MWRTKTRFLTVRTTINTLFLLKYILYSHGYKSQSIILCKVKVSFSSLVLICLVPVPATEVTISHSYGSHLFPDRKGSSYTFSSTHAALSTQSLQHLAFSLKMLWKHFHDGAHTVSSLCLSACGCHNLFNQSHNHFDSF